MVSPMTTQHHRSHVGTSSGAADAPNTNLVLITVDSLRFDALDGASGRSSRTPRLDQLAREGTELTQAITNGPRTQGSFPSILASLYPLAAGEKNGMPTGVTTIAESLSSAGYRTAGFNPSNPFLTRESGYHRGFDSFTDFWDVHPRRSEGDEVSRWRKLRRRLHNIIGRRNLGLLMLYQATFQGPAGQYLTGDVIIRQALDWVRDQRSPWFTWLHFMDVHYPYQPLRGERTIIDRARWFACMTQMLGGRPQAAYRAIRSLYDRRVQLVDTLIGDFLDGLQRTGLAETTVVAMTSDHGERFAEHGTFGHGPDVVEELLRVPLILRGPGVPRSATIGCQTQLLDLAPTLLELMAVPIPASFTGQSMAPLLRGSAAQGVKYVFSEAMHSGARTSRVGTPDCLRVISCRGERWKYIHDAEGPVEELYDLTADPEERHNLASEHSQIVDEMRMRVAAHDAAVTAHPAESQKHACRVDEGDDDVRRRLADLGYL